MRKLVIALGATFVVLLGTGVHQTFNYRPGGGGSFLDDSTSLVHRLGAAVFCGLVFAAILMWILRERASSRATLLAVVVLTVLALATIAEMITGRGLRWDQVALLAVTVGDDIGGVVGIEGAKYVIIGTTELSWGEFSTRVFLHLVVFPIGLVICGGVLWFLSTRNARRRTAIAGSFDEQDGNNGEDMVKTAT